MRKKSSENYIKIIDVLREGEKTFSEIANKTRIPRMTLYRYIKDLEREGIIKIEERESKYGKKRYYILNMEKIDPIMKLISTVKPMIEKWYNHIVDKGIDEDYPLSRFIVLPPSQDEYIIDLSENEEIYDRVISKIIELYTLILNLIKKKALEKISQESKEILNVYNERLLKLGKKLYPNEDYPEQFLIQKAYSLLDTILYLDEIKKSRLSGYIDYHGIKLYEYTIFKSTIMEKIEKYLEDYLTTFNVDPNDKEIIDLISWYKKNKMKIEKAYNELYKEIPQFLIVIPWNLFLGYRYNELIDFIVKMGGEDYIKEIIRKQSQ